MDRGKTGESNKRQWVVAGALRVDNYDHYLSPSYKEEKLYLNDDFFGDNLYLYDYFYRDKSYLNDSFYRQKWLPSWLRKTNNKHNVRIQQRPLEKDEEMPQLREEAVWTILFQHIPGKKKACNYLHRFTVKENNWLR